MSTPDGSTLVMTDSNTDPNAPTPPQQPTPPEAAQPPVTPEGTDAPAPTAPEAAAPVEPATPVEPAVAPAPIEPAASTESAPTPLTAEPDPAPAAADPASAADSSHAGAADAADEPHPDLAHLDIRLGTIAGVKNDQIRVDFKHGDERAVGLCPVAAFKKVPRVGEHVEFVVESTDTDGTLRIARAPQVARIGWKSLSRGQEIDVQVTGMNTGGLEIKIPHTKVRGFMPSSQIDVATPEDLTAFLGKTLHVRVMEVNTKKRRLVVSRRVLVESDVRAEKLANLNTGDEITGKVRNVTDFGAFVEIEPGLDGLVRVHDIAWHHVETPADALQAGQEVKAKVTQIERKSGKVSLSIKALLPNPWNAIAEKYPVGSKQSGTVSKLTDFGAFVELEPGIEGLIHISQLSDRRIEKVEHAVKVGQTVEFKVREVDPRRRRVSLSIRALTQPEEERAGEASRDDIRKFTKREKDAKAVESLMAKFGGGDLKGGIG